MSIMYLETNKTKTNKQTNEANTVDDNYIHRVTISSIRLKATASSSIIRRETSKTKNKQTNKANTVDENYIHCVTISLIHLEATAFVSIMCMY